MRTIKIHCQNCQSTHEVNRTDEVPLEAISMKCNYCPLCEHSADDYYKEWYDSDDGYNGNIPADVSPNQTSLPFTIENIKTKTK